MSSTNEQDAAGPSAMTRATTAAKTAFRAYLKQPNPETLGALGKALTEYRRAKIEATFGDVSDLTATASS